VICYPIYVPGPDAPPGNLLSMIGLRGALHQTLLLLVEVGGVMFVGDAAEHCEKISGN
jgi:hypothetical protein